MPKKPRSARRQAAPKTPRSSRRKAKSTFIGGLGTEDNNDGGVDIDVLSETHTIADSYCSSQMDQSLDDNFSEFGEAEDIIEYTTTEGLSVESANKEVISATNRQNKLLESLSIASIMTTERRGAKRERSLRNLFKCITQYATGTQGRETILSQLDDVIIPICVAGLRGGIASPAEQYAACRVLEATSVLLGGNMDEFCENIFGSLLKVVKATGRAPQVRGAALRALSMAHFICASEFSTTEDVLDLCECVCAPRYRGEDVTYSLRATALDCWALLSTTVNDVHIAGEDIITGTDHGRGLIILSLLNDCLIHVNLDLKCAAGEVLALIHEARLNLGIDENEGGNASERRYARGSWDGSEREVLMDEMKQRVAELSVESGHHMSKKSKKEQKATFRDFMATIVEDEPPSKIISFRGGQLTLNTWKEIIQVNFIRHCLQSGFQIQLMTNSTLQIIFGADSSVLNSTLTLSQLEKRLTLSKTSDTAKAADREMRKRRKSRTKAQNYFLTADGLDL